jgi:Uma2 family endonuclease
MLVHSYPLRAYSESMSHPHLDAPRPHRLTVADYYRMAEVGILAPDARVELIEGEIIDMAPPGSVHAGTVDYLLQVLGAAVAGRATLRVQNPVRLSEYSELQPDLALLRPREDFYRAHHPRAEDVLLIIEVAASSLRFDRRKKVPLYARHGVPEVWLVDLGSQRLLRYRSPRQGTYASVDEPELHADIAIGSIDGVAVDLRRLFG